MALSKRYKPGTREPILQEEWEREGVYYFSAGGKDDVYAIDTPPPTVSGKLHLGHVYSYSQVDFLARFWRMKGKNVFYPMGYDDNGLPTEKLVEKNLGVTAQDIGRSAFIEKCLAISADEEVHYQHLWQRLGLSIDWRYTYRTIDHNSRRASQLSFLDLYEKGLAYRMRAPSIWCPECRTAIAQAELNEMELASKFVTISFKLDGGASLPIATTRPELLPACVAVFIHPDDERFASLIGSYAEVPIFGQRVEVKADPLVDTAKGSGAVMCCTFGDVVDVAWWHTHKLKLIEALDRDGRLTSVTGQLAGLTVEEARAKVIALLRDNDQLLFERPITHEVRVHERCDTPVEYIVANQWFVHVLDYKEQFLEVGEQVIWHPDHMRNRYRQWVENLGWDWCISRQRYFGVTFPLWYCESCGAIVTAAAEDLPVDPTEISPKQPCSCGSTSFIPETDVMDTWATSSLSPQLVASWLAGGGFDGRPFTPVTLRPQAHEIIRTWAFYSVVKAYHHFGQKPWHEVAISGWALAPAGQMKISKSRGGGPTSPLEMISNYSADAVRYWAASTGFGKDAVISEEKIAAGAKLVTKLWNVGRFCQSVLPDYRRPEAPPSLSPADRWILAALQTVITRVTEAFIGYEYASAKSTAESFLWNDLADNYLEMAKKRIYDIDEPGYDGAIFSLHFTFLSVLKLFAPFLPHVTEEIFRELFPSEYRQNGSIHRSAWPELVSAFKDEEAESTGQILVEIATSVRRFKSDRKLSLGANLEALEIGSTDASLLKTLAAAESDLLSVTRAKKITFKGELDGRPTVDLELAPVRILILDTT